MRRYDRWPTALMTLAHGPEHHEAGEDDRWVRLRQAGRALLFAVTLAAAALLLAVTALDAVVSALVGTRPVTLRIRDGWRLAADHYRWAQQPDVIDAEVIDPEGDVRR
jgi:hypothetical protein